MLPISPALQLAFNIAVGALVGLAVGLERERSGRTDGPDARFAGVRTFMLLGLLGGIAGAFAAEGRPLPASVLLGGGAAMAIAAYVTAVRRPGATADGTTEVAALVVLALAALAGTGRKELASAFAAIVVLALLGKARIHGVVERLGQRELLGALQFAVLALVVLPLLPDRTWGPWGGINPRTLWVVVLIFAAINYAGFLLHIWVGARRGYGATGVLGGLVSSTAVTLQFSRRSRDEPDFAGSLGVGILGACTVLIVRVAVVTTTLAPEVAASLVPYLVPPLLVGAGLVAWLVWRLPTEAEGVSAAALSSPLRLGSALQMAVAFQVALMAIRASREWFGETGVLTSAFLLGLTDMDALTFSMARLGREEGAVALAARAIALGILANTILKFSLAVTLGTPRLRKVAGLGLLALGVASGIGLAIVR